MQHNASQLFQISLRYVTVRRLGCDPVLPLVLLVNNIVSATDLLHARTSADRVRMPTIGGKVRPGSHFHISAIPRDAKQVNYKCKDISFFTFVVTLLYEFLNSSQLSSSNAF